MPRTTAHPDVARWLIRSRPRDDGVAALQENRWSPTVLSPVPLHHMEDGVGVVR